MLERWTALFPVLLLASLAALTFWLDRIVQPIARAADGSTRHDPDYIVENLKATRTDKEGNARYTLSATRMVHYPDDDTTHLTRPQLVSHKSRQAPVTITASEGLVSRNGENVYFNHEVKVSRAAYGERSELVVRTTYLHVIPDDHIARTDRPVTIYDAATVVDAVGLELNSETRIIKLLSRVRGSYDPRKAPKDEPKR